MLEKTNLEKVKMIARALLMTEIHETEFSPAVVQHPFTSSGITVLPRDGILQLGDICKNEKDLAAWQDYMKNRINNSTCAYYIYMMTNKPYGLTCKLYLLTADRALWRAAKRQMWNGKIILGRIRLACGTESSYTLLCCAKDLTLGTDHITAADLADREVISPKLFKIIETAVAIRRYGINEILTIE